MFEQFFNGRSEAIGPISGENFAGNVDSLICKIVRDEFWEKSEVLLKEIDVKEAAGVVAFPQNLSEMVVGEKGFVGPLPKF